MAKGVGSAILAMLLGAGFMFHSSAGHHAPAVPVSGVTPPQTVPATPEDGPWIASCKYWRPLRRLLVEVSRPAPSSAASRMVGNAATSDCSSQQWGVPLNLSLNGRKAHAVIATVPDPVHSHLAPEFDRALDVLMGAAADNGYLLSYSWLPWKPSSAKANEAADREDDREPGLLVFDQRSTSGETTSVLYMFLAAEMPADGVNAEQLQRALRYELQLRSSLGNGFAADNDGNLRVIGPQYSGSAMSLNLTINTVLMDGSFNTQPGAVKTRVILGTTSTETARQTLNRCENPCTANPDPGKNPQGVYYQSFASSQAVPALTAMFKTNGDNPGQAVLLAEDGTFYGLSLVKAGTRQDHLENEDAPWRPVPFPREISSLRNSYRDGDSTNAAPDAVPTPYLRLSTHDDGSQDTLPDFSTSVTPLSQEAQLMSISHLLTQLHAKFAYVVASNPLDAVFLAKSLHRSNPDTRLIMEPDLLLQRDSDDTPYIGSLGVTPYPLVWLARSKVPLRSFASAEMEAFYNAASFTVAQIAEKPAAADALYGYNNAFPLIACATSKDSLCPRLWLTTIGSDGYYPIALLNAPSEIMGIRSPPTRREVPASTVYPSGAWQALCVLVALTCLLHIAALCSASYASTQTCDLEIKQNCAPHRRALYIQIGGATLFLMGAVVSMPVISFLNQRTGFQIDGEDGSLALITAALGIAGWLVAIVKTFASRGAGSESHTHFLRMKEESFCSFLYAASALATLLLAGMWLVLCLRSVDDQRLGLFFSYRCLHPLSGVSPVAPALLLLWGWLFWAVMHTRRLRLTRGSRPRLPDARNVERQLDAGVPLNLSDLFVSDSRLQQGPLEDTNCLMISRRLLQKILRANPEEMPANTQAVRLEQKASRAHRLDFLLLLLFAGLTFTWVMVCPIRTLDHFGWKIGFTTLYEAFIGLLLVPLLVLALCAAARLFLISSSLREHLLEPLERMPLRHAFTRLKGFSWVSMLREGGQQERWRDMARSTEAICHIVHHPAMQKSQRAKVLANQYQDLETKIAVLHQHIHALRQNEAVPSPKESACRRMDEIEKGYAACAEEILLGTLLPRWMTQSYGLLQSSAKTNAPNAPDAPSHLVLLAEEFLAIRYVAFIRAILVQMRYLLIFITAALVLVILAINSYPFQPRQELNWCVTAVFFAFSVGIVSVLAQMHRNTMLSRITNKTTHGLGLDFYLRVAAFGVLPLLTWLATQYPGIGGTLYGVIKPGLDAVK